jgi:hypothetical protein
MSARKRALAPGRRDPHQWPPPCRGGRFAAWNSPRARRQSLSCPWRHECARADVALWHSICRRPGILRESRRAGHLSTTWSRVLQQSGDAHSRAEGLPAFDFTAPYASGLALRTSGSVRGCWWLPVAAVAGRRHHRTATQELRWRQRHKRRNAPSPQAPSRRGLYTAW